MQTARAPAATRSVSFLLHSIASGGTSAAANHRARLSSQFVGARPAKRALAVRPRAAAATTISKSAVPLALEEGEMPLNTYGNKAPFIAKIKSVQRIVGPKATGETCHIIIETDGKIPFWEGQSYGVIPPVRPAA